jgi:hypothetical protein
MFSIKTRKNVMSNIINGIESFMYANIYPSNIVNGFIILLFHWIIVGWTFAYIVVGKIDALFFMCVSTWILIFALHVYFHGCILTKVEKHLWQADDWCGPWSLPFKLLEYNNVSVTSGLAQNIFICWAIAITIFVALKIIYYI